MGVDTSSITYAAAQLLSTPQETEEQVEESTLEQESPEEAQEQEVLEDSEELDQEESEDEYEEEPDTEEPEDEQEASEEMYTVKVDGEEYEVNFEELVKGYQLEKNVTKKSQQLSEERKQLQDLKADLESQRDRYLAITAELANQTHSQVTQAKEQLKKIDREEDPVGYLTKQAEIADMERDLNAQVEQFQRSQAEQQAQFNKERAEFIVQQEAVLAERLEGWGDPETSPQLKQSIAQFAVDSGYTPEELANVVDARDIMVLNKARLYDELQSKRTSISKKKAPAKVRAKIKANASTSDSTKKARLVKSKRDQLSKTGKPKDAAALMLELMQNRQKR